jgi:hypothetical protein
VSQKVAAALHGRTYFVGDRVTIRSSTAVYKIVCLRDERDAADVHYIMADLISESGRITTMEETTWLRPAPPKKQPGPTP